MLTASENDARTPPAALHVEPDPRASRSRSTTSRTPARLRWWATLSPITPPPMTTTEASFGSSVDGTVSETSQCRPRVPRAHDDRPAPARTPSARGRQRHDDRGGGQALRGPRGGRGGPRPPVRLPPALRHRRPHPRGRGRPAPRGRPRRPGRGDRP